MIFVVTFYQHEARQVPEQEGEGGDSSAFWRPELVLPLKKKRLGGVFGGSFSPLVPSPGQVLPSAAAEGSRSDGSSLGEAEVGGNLGCGDLRVPPRSPNPNPCTEFTFRVQGFGSEV